MSLAIVTEPVPLAADAAGVVRVAGTRVSLASVVFAFQEGSTAEEIAQQYPSLELADVYSVIGYYLQHRAEVEDYLRRRQTQRDKIREEVEARFSPHGIRERLLARRTRPDA